MNETKSNLTKKLGEEKQTRKSFLNYILGFGFLGWMGGILYPVFKYLDAPEVQDFETANVSIANVKEFETISSKMFKVGKRPGILIKTPDGEFKAFNATCTHLDCTVQLKKDEEIIWCACHNGKYDLNGKNISGPPPSPLPPIEIVIKNEEIFAIK
jgi:cytochrome b6-f complex iron-sulfur subunit